MMDIGKIGSRTLYQVKEDDYYFLVTSAPPTQSLVPQLLPLSLACLRKEIMLGTQLLAQFCDTTRHMGSCGWYILLPITTHHMASCDTELCKKLCP